MPADRLSLYIDLEEGRRANVEAVSRAAIAFAELVREAAAYIDPLADVSLEFVDTTEGSIFYNTKVKFVTATGVKEITLYALILICLSWIGVQTITFLTEKGLTAA